MDNPIECLFSEVIHKMMSKLGYPIELEFSKGYLE